MTKGAKAREASNEIKLTAAAFVTMRQEAYEELAGPNVTRDEAYALAVKLRVLRGVERRLSEIIEDYNIAQSIQGEQG